MYWNRLAATVCAVLFIIGAKFGASQRVPLTDAIAMLQEKIDSGKVTLPYDEKSGYLAGVLHALDISPTSQVLVFSKTSFQISHISPETPRALYFNDDVYIGWVQNGQVIEMSAADKRLGAVYYTLSQERSPSPKVEWQTNECLICHNSPVLTEGLSGHIVRSVHPNKDGIAILSDGAYVTTDRSPVNERWGGWYVTARRGSPLHMGNRTVEGPSGFAPNIPDLGKLIDTTPYQTPYSDVVALMVLAHQTHVHNLIANASSLAQMSEPTMSRIKGVAEPLVRALLFVGEAQLTEPVVGVSGFSSYFETRGPRDRQGRSLRQFDLQKRLFKYPCSYLIYAEAFNAMPEPVKDYVYQRLWEVISGQDSSPDFNHLSASDRKAIASILEETKPSFAAWKKAHVPGSQPSR